MNPQLKTTREEWIDKAQSFEAEWWRTYWNPLHDPLPESLAIIARLGYRPEDFAGKRVLDIGPGPTRRLACLKQWASSLEALEPLAGVYLGLEGGTALSDYSRIFPFEAEHFEEELAGAFNFIFAINSLDHVFDLTLALENLRKYLAPGGRAMLSMDCDKGVEEDPTHPVILSGAGFRSIVNICGLQIVRASSGECPAVRFDGATEAGSWGGGLAYHLEVMKRGI